MDEQVLFPDRDEFRKWLYENHSISKGVWLVFSKIIELKTLKADEALEEALCFGCIDGQIQSVDNEKYLKKFTPRRKGSKWSEKNRNTANKLIENGKMTEHGIASIERAKREGTWNIPKEKPVSESQIKILTGALKDVEPALSNFMKMPLSVRKTYTAAYLDAKREETRVKRLQKIIGRLNENKKPM